MKHGEARFLSCMYVLSLTLLMLFAARGLRQSAMVSAEAAQTPLVILDAGHGGTDGGSSAADGTLESNINLQITLKTDAILGLLGQETLLVRTTDTDLADESATTIAQKKVTDIRNRVSLINSHPEALLVSIHQNAFSQEKYYGAQVFYGSVGESKLLAETLQQNFNQYVDSTNRRKAKSIQPEVYLMNHIEVPGILVECGFLSNPSEAEKLKTDAYQNQLAVAIAVTAFNHLSGEDSGV